MLKATIETLGFLGVSVLQMLLKCKNIEEFPTSTFYLYGRNKTYATLKTRRKGMHTCPKC